MGEQRGFIVDPAAVHTFGTDFQHDLDVHLSSEKVQTLHLFSETPVFGSRTASPEVHKTASDYTKKLLELFDIMDAMIHEGSLLAGAAHAIAEAYADADSISSADIGEAIESARVETSADLRAVDPKTGRPI